MPEPVIVTAEFTPRPGRRDALVEALRIAIAEVHEEEGCLLYALHDAADGTIVMIEKWSTTTALDAHAAGAAVARLDASIAELIARPVIVTRLAPIPAGTSAQGVL
jgi:quinol monooxygenase YgiN